MIGLLKTAVIRRRGPWRGLEAVELAALEGAHRFNTRRLLGPIGHVPPAEAEAAFHAQLENTAVAPWLAKRHRLQERRGGSRPSSRRPLGTS